MCEESAKAALTDAAFDVAEKHKMILAHNSKFIAIQDT
jgi:hypothetical protein